MNSKEENSFGLFCPNYVQEFGLCLETLWENIAGFPKNWNDENVFFMDLVTTNTWKNLYLKPLVQSLYTVSKPFRHLQYLHTGVILSVGYPGCMKTQ